MKKLITAFAMISFFGAHQLLAQNGRISKQEQLFLLDYLELTKTNIINTLNDLDESQWTYKPAGGGWSIQECTEHILLAEEAVFGQVQQALTAEANNDLSTKNKDAWLISKISDRSTKVKTPLEPNGDLRSKSDAIKALTTSRAELEKYLRNDKLELRNHFGKSPYGSADAYQLFLVIAAHSMRHHSQMMEVLAAQQAH